MNTDFFKTNLDCRYFFCLDGGGSKTALQVLDSKGNILFLENESSRAESLVTVGSNVNTLGYEAVVRILKDLFKNLTIGENYSPFEAICHQSCLVAGLAGIEVSKENLEKIRTLFQALGFERDCIYLGSDVTVAKSLLQGDGVLLIAGTGSVCFARLDSAKRCAGGYGPLLGDEGSGFDIGKKALQVALDDDSLGVHSFSLTPQLCQHFKVASVSSIVSLVYTGDIKPAQIAGITPYVFEEAYEKNDVKCQGILLEAASNLAALVNSVLRGVPLSSSFPLYLIGGVFKSQHASKFIDQMVKHFNCQDFSLINLSAENIPAYIVRKVLAGSNGSVEAVSL